MSQKLLLVDFENVQQVDLAQLDDTFQIVIFVGANQKSVPIELVTGSQKLSIEWQRIDASGNNALDFFIACQLGRALEKSPKQQCLILSKDKGFDPLLRHLNKMGLQCRRLNSLLELSPKLTGSEEPHYKRVVELLGKSEKKSRPRKRTTLLPHISSMFQKKICQGDIDRIIDSLFANRLISETNGAITYQF